MAPCLCLEITHIQPAPHVTRIYPTDGLLSAIRHLTGVQKLFDLPPWKPWNHLNEEISNSTSTVSAVFFEWWLLPALDTVYRIQFMVTRPWKTNQKLATNVASKFSPAFFLTFGMLGICWLMPWPKRISWIQLTRPLKQLFQASTQLSFTRLVTDKAGIS